MSMAPANRLARLPPSVSHWLGYRATPPKPIAKYLVWFWSFVGAFCGLSVLQAVFGQAHYFIERGVPSIIASYGASAVLCYGAIEAPLAQPRALVVGHFISALIGICITKLFALSSHFDSLRWLAGSLSTSLAIVAMQITATTHPPAGATALIFATNDEVRALSWYYLPVILLSSMLVLAVALLVDNVQRRYPVFWIEHVPPPPANKTSEPVAVSTAGSVGTEKTAQEGYGITRGRTFLEGGGEEAVREQKELDSERIV